jgi:hypothetical protein
MTILTTLALYGSLLCQGNDQSPWIDLNYSPKLLGWTIPVQVNNVVVRAAINLSVETSTISDEMYERISRPRNDGKLGFHFATGQTVNSRFNVVSRQYLHSTFDLILGREAFREMSVTWDIPNSRFRFASRGDDSSRGTTRSMRSNRFRLNKKEYQLPGFFVASQAYEVLPTPSVVKFPSGEPYMVKERVALLASFDDDSSEVIESNGDASLKGAPTVPGASLFGDQIITIDLKTNKIRFEDRQILRTAFLLNLLGSIQLGVSDGYLVLKGHSTNEGTENYRERGLLGSRIDRVGDTLVDEKIVGDPRATLNLLNAYQTARSYGIKWNGQIVWLGRRDEG